ncbi:protein unc-93 homolog A [Argonauta hians]
MEEKHVAYSNNEVQIKTKDMAPEYQDSVNTSNTPPMSKLRVIKNGLIVSFGFLFLFTSFQALMNLQSTLNKEENVGLISTSVLYAALILSCLFLPPPIIGFLGCKWTIAASMVTYTIYVAGNFYPKIWMMVLVSIIVGLGAAPLWSAKCAYLTEIGIWYARWKNINTDSSINHFFGVFFMIFQSSQIWGNLISSLVLGQNTPLNNSITELMNVSCGVDFDLNTKMDSPISTVNPDQVNIMKGIYLLCCILAIAIICLFLDNIRLEKEAKQRSFSIGLVKETARHCWVSTEQKLLIPLTIYSGIEQAFILITYTSAYITCSLGVWNIGYIMISFGVVDAICSFAFGRLVQYIGHIPFFILATIVHGGIQISLLLWTPSADMKVLFYIISGLWGMGDAVIQTQINALYGFLFSNNTEAAFANYRLWESVGFVMTFAYSTTAAVATRLYICLGFLFVGMLGYVVVEVRLRSVKASVDLSCDSASKKYNLE